MGNSNENQKKEKRHKLISQFGSDWGSFLLHSVGICIWIWFVFPHLYFYQSEVGLHLGLAAIHGITTMLLSLQLKLLYKSITFSALTFPTLNWKYHCPSRALKAADLSFATVVTTIPSSKAIIRLYKRVLEWKFWCRCEHPLLLNWCLCILPPPLSSDDVGGFHLGGYDAG